MTKFQRRTFLKRLGVVGAALETVTWVPTAAAEPSPAELRRHAAIFGLRILNTLQMNNQKKYKQYLPVSILLQLPEAEYYAADVNRILKTPLINIDSARAGGDLIPGFGIGIQALFLPSLNRDMYQLVATDRSLTFKSDENGVIYEPLTERRIATGRDNEVDWRPIRRSVSAPPTGARALINAVAQFVNPTLHAQINQTCCTYGYPYGCGGYCINGYCGEGNCMTQGNYWTYCCNLGYGGICNNCCVPTDGSCCAIPESCTRCWEFCLP
jgi:hypothetical protein